MLMSCTFLEWLTGPWIEVTAKAWSGVGGVQRNRGQPSKMTRGLLGSFSAGIIRIKIYVLIVGMFLLKLEGHRSTEANHPRWLKSHSSVFLLVLFEINEKLSVNFGDVSLLIGILQRTKANYPIWWIDGFDTFSLLGFFQANQNGFEFCSHI